ncbi:hypothetical protein AAHB41_06130 [Pediococcus pentosaceus]|uniref:hypothetical protein n=1 Tax=Pediococcus pentosaceus TaxID=1255 RepID=UPI002FF11D5A
MNSDLTHYILTYSDGSVIEICLEGHEKRMFEIEIIPKIRGGFECIKDHNQYGKEFYNRNVVSLLALDNQAYEELKVNNNLPKMKQIGFNMDR